MRICWPRSSSPLSDRVPALPSGATRLKAVHCSFGRRGRGPYGRQLELCPATLDIRGAGVSRNNRPVKILVVDDDQAVRDALRRALALADYEVQSAGDGMQALDAIAREVPDAVVLDVGLPGIDGLEVCRRLRKLRNRVPILMLTARDAVEDRIDGLDAGADDYMVKPFDLGELRARLRALLRRFGEDAGEGELAREAPSFAGVALDEVRHGALVGETVVELTRTEYQLLELLLANPRQVLSHNFIYEHVWGYDFGPTSNALRVYVGYLRRKLEGAGAPQLIHTVRGVGYVLREP